MTELVDPSGLPRAGGAFPPVTEVTDGRRAFPVTQQIFYGSPIDPASRLEVGWHDSGTHPETGAFALVDYQSGLDALIGEIVRVTLEQRSVFVYVFQAADLETPLSLARRAFAAIGRLSLETAMCDVARTKR